MVKEVIRQVEITPERELLLRLESKGNTHYEYIYRDASGVYWDKVRCGFKSTPFVEWSPSKWFFYITDVVKLGLGVELRLSSDALWSEVSEEDKKEILQGCIDRKMEDK